LPEVIHNCVTTVQSLAHQKGLLIEVDVPDSLPLLHADYDRIVQVITNLLSNALKFTDEGCVNVRAWYLPSGETLEPWGIRQPDVALNLPAFAPLVIVSVWDTGVGISEADMPKVFEKFVQVGDRTSGARRPGTGLGLPICKEIVEHHGGQIWVESLLGKGSRFLFALPVPSETEGEHALNRLPG